MSPPSAPPPRMGEPMTKLGIAPQDKASAWLIELRAAGKTIIQSMPGGLAESEAVRGAALKVRARHPYAIVVCARRSDGSARPTDLDSPQEAPCSKSS